MIEIAEQQATLVMIPLDRIVSKLPVRRLSVSGVARIQESMARSGFLDNFPLIVAPLDDGDYQLIDGNHRYEAARAVGIDYAPCVVKMHLTEQERYKLALQSNSAAEAVVPSTLVTYAEFIWVRSGEGRTQDEIAEMMGWKRQSVRDYALLRKICPEAWDIIVATFEDGATIDGDLLATKIVANATFTEGLLRSILHLNPVQQIELVTSLATKKDFTKKKFKELAENYQSRKEAKEYALAKLGDIGTEYTRRLEQEIDKGAYDLDWRQNENHPKLHKLIEMLCDEWEQKNNTRRIYGDFYEEVRKIEDGTIDLIITDPPYNIANDRVVDPEGRSAMSQDFGDWDKYEKSAFLDLFPLWAKEWRRILKPQGSGYVFVADRYLSHLRDALEEAGFQIKSTLTWHKTNPGTQAVKTNYKSSVEFILFFTRDRGESGHTFNWLGDKGSVMHNFLEYPICEGKERLVDAQGNTLHPTQKPESVIWHLMERSSNPGDTIFDGFAGVFTVAKVAKDRGRKSISIEQNEAFFEAGKHRVEDSK